MMHALRARRAYAWLIAGVVALDQICKLAVVRSFELHESRELLPGLLGLTYVRNRGAAFGILSDAELPYQPALFAIVSLATLLAIVHYALRLPAADRLSQTGLALVTGGALGNLLDRARLGYVIDFVDVFWQQHHWPAFNVADSAITTGVCLLILDVLRNPAAARDEEPAAAGGHSD